jgi:hypothetical protein
MLVEGVTINDGKDFSVGVCATPIRINKRIAGMQSGLWPSGSIKSYELRLLAQIRQCPEK